MQEERVREKKRDRDKILLENLEEEYRDILVQYSMYEYFPVVTWLFK